VAGWTRTVVRSCGHASVRVPSTTSAKLIRIIIPLENARSYGLQWPG
jgi:hypothetical protein